MTSLLSIYQPDSSRSLREFAAKTNSPDPEGWRGRKRHRSLTRCEHEGANCGGTGESSNLRGRARRRSTSPVGTRSRTASRATARGEVTASLSPARKRLLRVLVLGRRRRSQSPSRSRSPNTLRQQPPRRRQRTRSRSRDHADTSLPPRRHPSQEEHQAVGISSSSGPVAGLRQDVLRRQAASNQPQDIQMGE